MPKPKKVSSNQSFTSQQMIDIQDLTERTNNINLVYWYKFALFEIFVSYIQITVNAIYPKITEYSSELSSESAPGFDIKHFAALTAIVAVTMYRLGKKNSDVNQRITRANQNSEQIDNTLEKVSPTKLSAQVMNEFNINMTQEEVETNILQAIGFVISRTRLEKYARNFSRIFASIGLAEIVKNYHSEDQTSYITSVFYIEAIVHTMQLIRFLYRQFFNHPATIANAHLKQLQEIFSTNQWEIKKTDSFYYFSLDREQTAILVKIPGIQEGINIQQELLFRTIGRCLMQMQVPILFYSDEQIIVRDWFAAINQEQTSTYFSNFIDRYVEIEKFRDKKNTQLNMLINSYKFGVNPECIHQQIFDQNNLPQIFFVIKTSGKGIQENAERLLELKIKLVELYGENNVIIEDKEITVIGCKCVDANQLNLNHKKINSPIDENAFNNNNQNENYKRKTNKKEKEEQKAEQEQPLPKKYQMIRHNILNHKKLNADKIAHQLNENAANDEQYFPLSIPGRVHGSTYAKVSKSNLENKLVDQKDKKNFYTNNQSLQQCFKTLEQARVGVNVVSSNEIHTNDLPDISATRNDNNQQPQPSKWLSQSFFKVQHGKVSVYATKVEKKLVQEPAIDVECYDFDYLKLD